MTVVFLSVLGQFFGAVAFKTETGGRFFPDTRTSERGRRPIRVGHANRAGLYALKNM